MPESPPPRSAPMRWPPRGRPAFRPVSLDVTGIREAHEAALAAMATTRVASPTEKPATMHFERVVGSLVGSAFGTEKALSQKAPEARGLATRLVRRYRDEDRDGVAGFDGKAQRARRFAAAAGIQALAQLAAADGAVQAYRIIPSEDWKRTACAARQHPDGRSQGRQ